MGPEPAKHAIVRYPSLEGWARTSDAFLSFQRKGHRTNAFGWSDAVGVTDNLGKYFTRPQQDYIIRALEVWRRDQSTNLVSMQRFLAKLGGRQGTFVLQGSETVANGKIKATWFVVPGSGTGDLSGLRGEGGFEGDFGKGSRGTLDYWFE